MMAQHLFKSFHMYSLHRFVCLAMTSRVLAVAGWKFSFEFLPDLNQDEELRKRVQVVRLLKMAVLSICCARGF